MTSEADKAYKFRPYIQEDLNFIQNSWASSYYKGASYHDHVSPEEFHAHHRPIREKILNKPDATIIVCASKEHNDLILGWILVELSKTGQSLFLHFLYIKEAFKGQKIASELIKMALPTRPVICTHLTERAVRIMSRNPNKFKDFSYGPHLI